MSDDDDFMQDSEEDYDFEYEDDDDDDQGGGVDVENKYYNAKQMKLDNPEEAIDEFLGVPGLEEQKGDWGFKGLKQAIKLEFKLKRYQKVVEHYQELLTYVKNAVTRNYSEKSINNILDFIEKNAASDDQAAQQCLEEVYSKTLEAFQSMNNERLWLKTNIKLARLWFDRKDFQSLTTKLRELHKACQKEDGTDDSAKGTYSLEIYAIEILMYAETRNNKRLKSLYQRALRVKSAVPHPAVVGTIREAGGKMHLSEENWKEAQSDFFESFRNYDEAGSLQRIQVLKYLVLTTMLMGSDINPFDSHETKAYENDPRISGMTELIRAYQNDDITAYERVLQKDKDLLKDPVIAEHVDEVTRSMRTKSVLKLVKPYRRFRFDFIAKRLQISPAEAESIVAFLITDGQLKAKIDGPKGVVEVDQSTDPERTEALWAWHDSLKSLFNTMMEGDGMSEPSGLSDLPPGAGSIMPESMIGASSRPLKSSAPLRKLYAGD